MTAPFNAHVAQAASGRRAVLIGGVRTPFAKAGGVLEPLSAADLGRHAIVEALARTDVRASDVSHVVLGCGGMPSDAANIARVCALRAGIPHEVPAVTVQRNCASGMEAIAQASLLIESGDADVVICGGVESMSNYPAEFPRTFRRKMGRLARAKTLGARLGAMMAFRPGDFRAEWGIVKGLTDPACGLNMGETAEVLARELGITRDEQDAFALRSHQKALDARDRLAEEIAPIALPKGGMLDHDDAVRADQSMERLARLRPVFARQHGTVTAGNSCGVTDGACALVVAEARWAARHAEATGIEPLARIHAWSVAGVAPERMGLGPAAALPLALSAAGWSLEDLELLEINEAFAVQVMACLRVMADAALMARHTGRSEAVGVVDESRLNVRGGAIALGHPVGVSGARLALTLALEMRRRNATRGAASLCIGGGQGMAMLLERA